MPANPAYRLIRDELGAWQDEGLSARFWLRDDDAIAPTVALERLRKFALDQSVTIGLAVIPGKISNDLCALLSARGLPFEVMCHGYMHINHGSPDAPNEFGDARPLDTLVQDATLARTAFAAHFGNIMPFFVPPFAQISKGLAARLPSLGFRGLSNEPPRLLQRLAKKPRLIEFMLRNPASALSMRGGLSAHLDPINWRRGTAQAHEFLANRLLGDLVLRRKRLVAPEAPIGILTHHLVHDEAIWTTTQALVEELRRLPAVEFPPLAHLMDEYAFTQPSHDPAVDQVSRLGGLHS